MKPKVKKPRTITLRCDIYSNAWVDFDAGDGKAYASANCGNMRAKDARKLAAWLLQFAEWHERTEGK